MKLPSHEILWDRVRDRVGVESVNLGRLLDQFKARGRHLGLDDPEHAWEDGRQCGKARALAILEKEMTAWPKGSKAWQAIEAARKLDTLPADQRRLPAEPGPVARP